MYLRNSEYTESDWNWNETPISNSEMLSAKVTSASKLKYFVFPSCHPYSYWPNLASFIFRDCQNQCFNTICPLANEQYETLSYQYNSNSLIDRTTCITSKRFFSIRIQFKWLLIFSRRNIPKKGTVLRNSQLHSAFSTNILSTSKTSKQFLHRVVFCNIPLLMCLYLLHRTIIICI